MHEPSLYDSVEAFIARLEYDQAVPPDHIIRVDLYQLHIERAAHILRWELERWQDAKKCRTMSPTDLSEDAFELVSDHLKKAAWCAFIPASELDDYAASGVIVIDGGIAESGVVSVADQTVYFPGEAASRKGRS